MNTIRQILVLFLPILIFLFSCNKEEDLPKPSTFIASDGTYLGVVHLAYESIDGAENYEVVRLNNETAEWVEVSWTSSTNWDDYGWLLPNEIVPGIVYEYKVRSHANSTGFGPYSDIETGYAFDPEEVLITEVSRNYEESKNLITWSDPNDYSTIQNIVLIEYEIYYAYDNLPDQYYSAGKTTNLYYDHYIYSSDVDKVFTYKIETKYTYSVTNSDGFIYDAYYEIESDSKKEGSGGDGPEIVTYTRTDLGTVLTSGEAVAFTEIKQNGSNIYLGVLKDVKVTAYGIPAVYQFSGSSWTETGGTLPADITNSTSIDMIGITASSSKIYLAALDLDSIYIHESGGSSWSDNFSIKNLGYTEAPSSIDIEVLSDELYLAAKVYPDWDLKVFKWTGSAWETVGGDASGFITTEESVFEVTLNNFGGTLYLSYLIQNSDFNSTLNIKHLNGTSWDTDLEWTADNIMGINIAKGTNGIYFTSSTQALAQYKGGVYKVASSTTVEELISENDAWFYTPYDITIDSDGNVIICSHKLESATLNYPNLNLYHTNSWSTISGDFSDGIEPVSVHADGTNIIYVYGDKTNLTSWGDAKAIKSIKLTK